MDAAPSAPCFHNPGDYRGMKSVARGAESVRFVCPVCGAGVTRLRCTAETAIQTRCGQVAAAGLDVCRRHRKREMAVEAAAAAR